VPTSYGANQYVNELYNIRATIDGIELPGIVALNFKHKVNSSRIATITVESREGLEMMRIGGVLKINFGLSDAYANKMISYEEGTYLGLAPVVLPNDFYGRIKVIRPSLKRTSVTAMDLVSDLATSTMDNIQWRDYGSQDMYFVGKDICDYRDIDISLLNETTKYRPEQDQGILDHGFNIYGVQTRKSFLDKLFDLMSFNPQDTALFRTGTTPSGTYMSDPLPFIQFYYAIRQGKQMEFFAPNRFDKRNQPVLKIGPNEANIVGEGLVGQIDSSNLVNSVTIAAKDDVTKVVTLEDESSINKHGIFAQNFTFNTNNTNRMKEFAYTLIQKYREPTNTYKIQLTGAEWVQLGDLVEITSPIMGTKELFPVIEKEVSVSDSVVTKLTVGDRSISTKKLLELVSR
jgi:hypothetical protein